MMTADERFPGAYRAGYVQAQLEALGLETFTEADREIAALAFRLAEAGDYDAAERLAASLGTPQPPAGLSPEEQSDWWLAFYHGRAAGRAAS